MPNKNAVLVMYSGGLDSTLVASLMTKKFKNIHLVTYDVSATIGINNAKKMVQQLKDKFPENHFEHKIINANQTRNFIWKSFFSDYFIYCNRKSPGILCLGCKMAMLIESIKYCQQNNILYITNGMSRSQADHPECMPSIVNLFAQFMATYGIQYLNEVYEIPTRNDERKLLQEKGLSIGFSLGASNITHQPRCFIGVYSTLWKAGFRFEEKHMINYFKDKQDLLRSLLGETKEKIEVPGFVADETKPIKYTYEFGPHTDKMLSSMLMPLWLLSRTVFLLFQFAQKIKQKQSTDHRNNYKTIF